MNGVWGRVSPFSTKGSSTTVTAFVGEKSRPQELDGSAEIGLLSAEPAAMIPIPRGDLHDASSYLASV